MGAALSTTANGVLVALEQPTCHPGDVVQGVVCVNVVQPIQTTGIYLKLKVGWDTTTSHCSMPLGMCVHIKLPDGAAAMWPARTPPCLHILR